MSVAQRMGNKVFIINRSELEGRIDYDFYHPQIKKVIDRIHLKGFVKLNKITHPIKNGSTPSEGRFETSGIKYYRSQDFSLYTINANQYITPTFNQSIKRSYVKKNDILLAVVGATLGKIGFIHSDELEGNINQNVAKISIKDYRFYPEFIAIYLHSSIGQSLIYRYATITTQAYLNNEQLGQIPIPILDKESQQKIIALYQSAYSSKQKKEAQAKQLLESIDSYLLNELGIAMQQKKHAPKDRIFISSFSKVVGLRLDPMYFNNVAKSDSNKFDNMPLRKILRISKGQSITKAKITEGEYPVIAGGQTSPYTNGTYNFEGNVITISASGAYSGYVWYHNYPIFASDCNVLQSKDETVVNTEFVYFVLKALQSEIYKLQQGAGQPHVYARDIEKFTIPVPPIARQHAMLEHIKEIHKQNSKLQSEATSILEDAKALVEKMILG